MANKFQLKRTTVSGRTANTTDSGNTSFIDKGELAVNLADRKVFSSDSSNAIFEVGSNLTSLAVGSIVANGTSGTAGQILASNGTSVYWVEPSVSSTNVNASYVWTNSHVFTQTLVANGISISNNAAHDASLHLVGSTGGYNRFIQISPGANSVDILNIMASSNSTGGENWWSWGIEQDVYKVQVGVGFGGPGFTANNIGWVSANGFAGNGASITSVNASTVGGNSASDLRTYSSTVAGTAYSNAVSYTDDKIATANAAITGNAAAAYTNAVSYTDGKILAANVAIIANASAAYTNAVSYTDGKILTANSAITGNAATAYTNAVSYTDGKILTANSAITGNAATAYSNATSYTDTKIGTANSAMVANASAAYTNATAFASNGSNISTGTVAFARLPTVDSIANTSVSLVPTANNVKTAYDAAITANTNAATASSKADSAYTNAVSYTDTKIGTANTAMIANAAAAYTNATTYASNASNLSTGTVAFARLPTVDSVANTSVALVPTANNVKTAYDAAITANTNAATALTAAGSAYTNAVSYTDSKIATANSAITGNAATAYTNAVSYTDSKILTANSAITGNAATAYTNAVSYTDTKIGTANTAMAANAAAAYTNAVSYTDGKILTANSAITGNAATAYTNATTYASNASNLSTGTVAEARLPYRMNQNVRTTDSVEFADITLTGNLVVSGTRTYVNTTTLDVGDNIVTLNADLGANPPSQDAGIEIMRGTSANVQFIWDETNDRWSTNGQPFIAGGITTTTDLDLPTGGMIDWSNGDARIVEGLHGQNYSLSLQTFDGSSCNTKLIVLGNGSVGIGTTAPTVKTEIWGDLLVTGETIGVRTRFLSGKASPANTAGPLYIQYNSNDPVYIGGGTGTSSLTITGFANVSTSVNSALLTVGSSFIANTTGAYHTGTVNAASHTVGTSFIANTTGVTTTGFANVSTTLQVGTNTSTFGTAAYVVANGNFGVGTASPDRKLYVYGPGGGTPSLSNSNGEIAFFYSTTTQGLAIGADGTSPYGVWLQSKRANNDGTSYPLLLNPLGGSVGIGTTSPATQLDIRSATPTIRVQETTSGGDKRLELSINSAAIGKISVPQSASQLAFETVGTERMRIDSSGNVGIGTSTPSFNLDTQGNANSGVTIRAYNSNTGSGATSGLQLQTSTVTGLQLTTQSGYITGTTTAHPVYIYANNTTAATIAANGNFGIGTTTPGYKLEVNGSFAATTKSFLIDHPTKEGMKLRYGSLEGPENGVYIRGRLKGSNIIELPDYWSGLVDEDSITVNLTAVGKSQNLYVAYMGDGFIRVENETDTNIDCFYTVFAERKDVEKLEVEF